MSNYGPKQYKAYKPEDNARRKLNNTSDSYDSLGCNSNVKSYSSKPGQLSMKAQSDMLAAKQRLLNKKQPVKCLKDIQCPIERAEFLSKIKVAA